jgi:tetratricopeptide (TPR) repeat protein
MDRLAQLLKLHEADPADPFCTYGIALEHAKAGRSAEALTWLDKTLALDAAYCYAYFQKGKLLNDLGDAAGARRTVEAGIVAATQCGDAHARDELATLLDSIA